MASLEVDFPVFKALTALRVSEADSYNDVIRRLLKMEAGGPTEGRESPVHCIMRGVLFPEGTQFRVTFKGKTYEAAIRNGVWTGSDGVTHASPSRAANAITRTNVNGWRFWSCKRPGDASWRKLDELR